MKQYKIIEAEIEDAEKLMTDMAKEGWKVVSVTNWAIYSKAVLITFSQDT